MESFVVNRDLLSILDPDLTPEEFYTRCLVFIKGHFEHVNVAYIECDPDQNSLRVKAYGNTTISNSVYSKLAVSFSDSQHPYNLSFRINHILQIDGEEISNQFKYFKVYSNVTKTKIHSLYPIHYKVFFFFNSIVKLNFI